jgi:hypothetical protein
MIELILAIIDAAIMLRNIGHAYLELNEYEQALKY